MVLLRMLLKECNDVAVLREGDEFASKLQKLQPIVYSVDACLAIQCNVCQADRAYFDATWDEMGRIRALQSVNAANKGGKSNLAQ